MLSFPCPYTEDDAICFACEHGDHELHDQRYFAYGRWWECTCCVEDEED